MELKIEEYMDVWKSYFEEQEKQIQQVRSIRHDMQAHLIVLQYYLEEEKYEDAKNYLTHLRSQVCTRSPEREIEVGNPLVDVIIREYLMKSEDMILFSNKGKLPDKTFVTDYEWCTIFSNLISNATEACANICNTEKWIQLEISTDKENLCIVMKNPVEGIIKKEVFEGRTTKVDKLSHGYGLKNIKTIIEKHDGELKYSCKENLFTVEIRLKMR